MKKYFKYSQLSKKAQQKACQNYYAGAQKWLKKQYTWQECHEFCMDTDEETLYRKDGSDLPEEEYPNDWEVL